MLTGLQGMLVSAGVAGLLAFGAGWQLSADRQKAECQKQVAVIKKVADDLINSQQQEILTLQAETAQAQSEVAKVNAETHRQFAELQALLTADQLKREEASALVAQAANQAARDARTAAQRADAAREVIQNVADKCASAGVPDDVVQLLNGILAPTP
jgi:hypothetical protein